MTNYIMTLEELYEIILDRKQNPKKGSYVSSLFTEGIKKISQKVGEEASEVVIASLSETKERTIEETADLWFHTLVLLTALNIEPKEILEELEKRHKKATSVIARTRLGEDEAIS